MPLCFSVKQHLSYPCQAAPPLACTSMAPLGWASCRRCGCHWVSRPLSPVGSQSVVMLLRYGKASLDNRCRKTKMLDKHLNNFDPVLCQIGSPTNYDTKNVERFKRGLSSHWHNTHLHVEGVIHRKTEQQKQLMVAFFTLG